MWNTVGSCLQRLGASPGRSGGCAARSGRRAPGAAGHVAEGLGRGGALAAPLLFVAGGARPMAASILRLDHARVLKDDMALLPPQGVGVGGVFQLHQYDIV